MRKYLKDLTELDGISGRENKVREYIKEKLKDYADLIIEDVMGNLIINIKGKSNSKKIMIAAHMDEVGMMVTKVEENGFIKFAPVGGIDPNVLVAQRVRINSDIKGVVMTKPIHLGGMKKVEFKDLSISIGIFGKEIKQKVKIGDMITFDVEYSDNGKRAISKAFDDRVGCSIMMDIIEEIRKQDILPKYDLYFSFVTQEEVGLRGSGVAAYRIQPDVALILEGTTAGDNPELESDKWATHLGNGPAITFFHRGYVIVKEVFDKIVQTAEANKIKYQLKMRTAGGTDAARIARTLSGIPSGVISVPSRYIHSPNSVIDLEDYENTYELAKILSIEGRIAEI